MIEYVHGQAAFSATSALVTMADLDRMGEFNGAGAEARA